MGREKGQFESPRGNKNDSAPGQSKPPSVRRTRRDDFEEKDRAYLHEFQNTDIGIGTSPIEYGFSYPGASARYMGNEPQGYNVDTKGQGVRSPVQP